MNAIEIRKLNYSYFESTHVLRDVNLTVRQGEHILLVGPSGCGKSTLLLCLNGIIPHVLGGHLSGDVFVAGRDVRKHRVSEMAPYVQIVFQNPDDQLATLYVEDEVAFGPENLKLPREEILKRVDTWLEFVELSKFRRRNIYDLSGGQKQRLAIASVLAMEPQVLVLDGPMSNLDPVGRQEVLSVISKVTHELHLTMLIAEHNVEEVTPLVDRILVMNQEGRIVKDYSTREYLEDIEFQDDLGLWTPQISEIAYRLKKKGISIPTPTTLQDLYQNLCGFLAAEGSSITKYIPYHDACLETHDEKKSQVAIKVTDLSFTYPDGTQALDHVSFEIADGEFVALVGQNGCGKTTLALNLIGIYKPTSGQVIVYGKDVRKTSPRELSKEFAYIFQYPEHQFAEDNVYDEIAFGLKKRGDLTDKDLDEQVNRILSEIDLSEFKSRHPYDLSLGQKRRLSIATMTGTIPRCIILDEPSYGQDLRYNTQLMTYLRQLNSQGTTVLMITHNMKLVAEYVDKVLVMKEKRLIKCSTPRSLFADTETLRETKLSAPPVTQLSLRLFNQADVSVREFISRFGSA